MTGQRGIAGVAAVLLALAVTGCAGAVGGSAAPVAGAATSIAIGGLTSVGSAASGGTGDNSGQDGSADGAGRTDTPSTSGPEPTSSPSAPTAATTRTTVSTQTTGPSSTIRTSWALGTKVTSAAKNRYGDVQAEVGKVYGLVWSKSNVDALAWVVDSIIVDSGCNAGTPKPTNGHFVVMSLRVEVRNSTLDDLEAANISLSTPSWTAFDAHGAAETGIKSDPALDCVTGHTVYDLHTDRITGGKVAFDVSSPKGTLVLAISGIESGWEYHYGH